MLGGTSRWMRGELLSGEGRKREEGEGGRGADVHETVGSKDGRNPP